MKLFLFGDAHDEHRQLSQGSLLAAWGGKVITSLPPGCRNCNSNASICL